MAGRLVFLLILAVCGGYGASVENLSASPPYDVIVVGLGSAGTTAASALAQAGRRVLALDAQAHVGGRVRTVPFADGVVELGAEWVHGTKPSRIYDAAVENNITLISQGGSLMTYKSDGSLPDQELINELANYCMSINEKEPPATPEPVGQFVTRKLNEYLKENHPKLQHDSEFLEGFLDLMNLMTNSVEASTNWNEVSTSSDFKNLEGDLNMSWHSLGYKTFFDILLNKYNNGPGLPTLEIQLNKEVTQVAWPQQPEQQVVVTCSDGSVYTAHAAIVTVSLGVLKERHSALFSPQLPQEKITAIEKIRMGLEDKIILSWNEPWWKDPWIGFLWGADKANVEAEDYWTTRIGGASNPMGARNALTLWITGDIAKFEETLPNDVVKTKSMELLRRFMGANTTIPEPTGMLRSKWFSDPFTRGSYSFDGVGAPPGLHAVLGAPLTDSAGQPRLLFAGEATNPTHFGTVHGASETGYREAMRLLNVTCTISICKLI